MGRTAGFRSVAPRLIRLIIGYNMKTQEIIFSDSWGTSHEQKRMPMDNANTITTGLTALEPL